MTEVAIIGIYYDEDSPLDSYRGCYVRFSDEEFGVWGEDVGEDMLECIDYARSKTDIILYSSSVDNYDSDCLRAAKEKDNVSW